MRPAARGLFAVVCGSIIIAFATSSVLAAGPPAKVTVTTPDYPDTEFGRHIVPCGVDIRLEALVVDATEAPVEGIEMAWTWEDDVDILPNPKSPDDQIRDVASVTDANGIATSSVYLACVVGIRGVSAGTLQALGSVDLNVVTVPTAATPPLAPNTSTAQVPGASTPVPIAPLLVLAAVPGAAAFLRRRPSAR